jgi:arginine decarboxylase-like protein
MSLITSETRRESYHIMMQDMGERQQQCIEGLIRLGGEATANELAMHLFQQKVTPFYSRNFVHPRLNELVEQKVVEVIGKRKDQDTNRNVAVYKLGRF